MRKTVFPCLMIAFVLLMSLLLGINALTGPGLKGTASTVAKGLRLGDGRQQYFGQKPRLYQCLRGHPAAPGEAAGGGSGGLSRGEAVQRPADLRRQRRPGGAVGQRRRPGAAQPGAGPKRHPPFIRRRAHEADKSGGGHARRRAGLRQRHGRRPLREAFREGGYPGSAPRVYGLRP